MLLILRFLIFSLLPSGTDFSFSNIQRVPSFLGQLSTLVFHTEHASRFPEPILRVQSVWC